MLTKKNEPRCNVQILYWETESKVVRTQDPDIIKEILRDGLNLYPLLSLDIQLINAIRCNTTVTITEELHLFPSLDLVYAAGAPDTLKNPIPKNFKDFQLFLAKLKQNRWETLKKIADTEDRKRELLKGLNDTLTDNELFQLSKSLQSETHNIEYSNLKLARESNYISMSAPPAIKLPRVRTNLAENWAEADFIQSCKPTNECVRAPTSPFWKDGMDFQHRQEHVLYKLAEREAKFVWKKDRQDDKDLNIHLPVGIDYLEWKQNQEKIKKNDIKISYQKILLQMNDITNDVKIEDILMDRKIRQEEDRMKAEMKKLLQRYWFLQKEKTVIADAKLFDLGMLNPRCLPIVNSLKDEPNKMPKFNVKVMTSPLALEQPTKKVVDKNDDEENQWTGRWSD